MMLSKRITAKSRELNPANQARKRMVNDSKDCHPAGCVSPPDRPPAPHPAGELGRPLPETEPPALELALCLQSEAVWCSAMFWRIWLGKHFPPPRTPLSTNPLPPRRQYSAQPGLRSNCRYLTLCINNLDLFAADSASEWHANRLVPFGTRDPLVGGG